jgi:hypothetical protein
VHTWVHTCLLAERTQARAETPEIPRNLSPPGSESSDRESNAGHAKSEGTQSRCTDVCTRPRQSRNHAGVRPRAACLRIRRLGVRAPSGTHCVETVLIENPRPPRVLVSLHTSVHTSRQLPAPNRPINRRSFRRRTLIGHRLARAMRGWPRPVGHICQPRAQG